jgi:hypothetical protein
MTTQKKPLLDLNSPTYLRRLARELNALPDGFYHKGQRYNQARVHSMAGEGGKRCTLSIFRPDPVHVGVSYSTGITGECVISDAYGRTVCASRKA